MTFVVLPSYKYVVVLALFGYPPHHSKYNPDRRQLDLPARLGKVVDAGHNPIERVFGVLENYWNGDPLETIEKALGMAEGMTYKGVHPTATLIETVYPKGVRLTKKQMRPYEAGLQRLAGLGRWFVTITATAPLSSIPASS